MSLRKTNNIFSQLLSWFLYKYIKARVHTQQKKSAEVKLCRIKELTREERKKTGELGRKKYTPYPKRTCTKCL